MDLQETADHKGYAIVLIGPPKYGEVYVQDSKR